MVDALQRSTGSNATLWTIGRAVGVPALSAAALLALVAALLAWAWRRRPAPLVLIAAAVPVSVAVAPHGWTYDQLHLLVSAAVVLGIVERAPWRTLALVILVTVTALLPWWLYLIAVARHSEDWSALVPVAMFALVLACDRAAERGRAPHATARSSSRTDAARDAP
jgi:glucan phosphoethanolaminetransferase (alkaline phosphatase superfamily)